MDSIGFVLNTFEEEEEPSPRVMRRVMRNKAENFMQLPDTEFKNNFRLSKPAFLYVLGELKQELKPCVRSTSLPTECKLAACLRFFAEGGYQRGTGKDFHVGIAQPTFSQHFADVLNVLERKLCPKWISLSMAEDEKMAAKRHFFDKSGIPGVIMCVDGTHIKIFKPAASPHLFYNRKGFYSLNAMIICDHRQRIRYVDAKHPGACHDSFIWNSSDAVGYFENKYINGDRNTRLLGDAGYPLQPWLITPFRTTTEGTAESRFNKAHSKARITIERTIGILKNRFRCLLGARELHYSPQKAVQIINVCCALHNICTHYDVNDEEFYSREGEEVTDDAEWPTHHTTNLSSSTEGARIRNEILTNFEN